ncbi:MAG: Mrp/NBP35 family ATP-binding protein [Caulobacteraceae bacterium]
MTDPNAALRTAVLDALQGVKDPKSGKGLVEAGLVNSLVARDGRAGFMMEVAAPDAEIYEPIRAQAEFAIRALPGIERAYVAMTAEREPPPAPGITRVRKGAALSPRMAAETAPRKPPPSAKRIPHVRHVIAVASGKGGVGKSTVALNLACALAARGLRTGLLDADIYGPSIPRMTGLSAEPQIGADKKLIPLAAWGLRVMSIGLIVDEAAPMIWRGPMAASAFNQMTWEVAWGSEAEPLDVLVIDLPPGTGDVQLSLAQRVVMDGAVIVSTPQEVALIDARRAAEMFRKTAVPVLGLVENMAFLPNPSGEDIIDLFGRGGARTEAERLGVTFLGEIPIDIALRQACDAGTPLVATQPDSPAVRAFTAMAELVAAQFADS